MTSPFVSRIGGILSADAAVPEHERVKRFYSRVLGTGAEPLWRDDLMNAQGIPIIGLGPRAPEFGDLPVQWMPHMQVADVAATAQRAVALGGREFLHGKNDAGNSQWAVLQDPQGALFGVIPVVPPEVLPPAQDDGEPRPRVGCIFWVDLTVPDAVAIREFYREVIGWSVQDVAMEDAGEHYADYNMLGGDGNPAAGICHARGANEGLPPVWMLYLPVGDIEESLRRVGEEGGKVVKATRGKDGACAFAVVQDPVGMHLALMTG